MTSQHSNTIWTKIEKALNTQTLDINHELSAQSPQPKRRSSDQLSAEKVKSHKLNRHHMSHETSSHSIQTHTSSSVTSSFPTSFTTTSTTAISSSLSSPMASSNTSTTPRPKMLRIPTHQLPNHDCVAAFSTRDAILRRDAFHEVEEVKVTKEDVIKRLSDSFLNTKHTFIMIIDTAFKTAIKELLSVPENQVLAFFSISSEDLKQFSSNIFTKIFSLTIESFPAASEGEELHREGCQHITECITANLAPTIIKYKDVFLSTVLSPARNDINTKPLVELIINTANYDTIWLEVIYALPTAFSPVTAHTLLSKVSIVENKVTTLEHNHTEMDHQITKIATRMGDLRTSEMEQRSKAIENDIRIHNINSLDDGTVNHFRTLNYTNQIARIHKLVSEHITTNNPSFTTQIFSPKSGSKHFEALAYVKFSSRELKFEFEKNFANFKRNNPGCKVTTSRPAPPRTQSDRDMPTMTDIKTRIGMLYNQAVISAKHKNPNIAYNPLNQEEIDAIQVSLKERHRPYKVFYEFLCPTNNTTFMPYTLTTNPFSEYDFKHSIPNPITRKHAQSDKSYEQRFPPRIHKK